MAIQFDLYQGNSIQALDDCWVYSGIIKGSASNTIADIQAFYDCCAECWTPLELLPLAWYDPSDTASIIESGGLVSQLNDKSTNDYHLTAAGIAQPITGSRTINSLNVLDFDGINTYLGSVGSILASTPSGINTPISIHFVYQSDLNGPDTTILGWGRTTDVNPRIINGVGIGSDTIFERRTDTPDTETIYYSAEDTTAHVISAIYDGTKLIYWEDGVLQPNVALVQASGPTLDSFSLGALIGPTVGEFFNGAIGEVIIQAGASTTDEQAAVTDYLNNKWK